MNTPTPRLPHRLVVAAAAASLAPRSIHDFRRGLENPTHTVKYSCRQTPINRSSRCLCGTCGQYSYNAINGVPACGNEWLLTEVCRRRCYCCSSGVFGVLLLPPLLVPASATYTASLGVAWQHSSSDAAICLPSCNDLSAPEFSGLA